MSDIDEKADEGETILWHVNQLRIRLTWAAGFWLVGTLISFKFAPDLIKLMIAPYGSQLQTLSPTEGVETYFKVALVAGAILAMPFMLYQFWKFIDDALESEEKRSVYIFVPGATILFLLGVAFTWYVLLPTAILFLSQFMQDIFVSEWTSQEYISFMTTFLFWIGVSFEMPLVVYLLARYNLVTAVGLRTHWRFAIVGIAIIAAAVTPSIDPLTMLLTMVPLFGLYIFSIGLAYLGERQFKKVYQIE